MKVEVGTNKPDNFKETWEGQFESFSHYEFICGIPHILIAITTLKENGKPNVCLHAWNCFQGDKEGYFAILAGISHYSHTYANIMRTGEFCINFLSKQYFDSLLDTIKNNKEEDDEFAAGEFTAEPSGCIAAPRIKESFLSLECRKENIIELTSTCKSSLVIGRVVNIAAEEEYAKGLDKKYGEDGFMFNIHSPRNLFTGEECNMGVATLNLSHKYS